MATSFITFKNDNGFWIRDSMMEVVVFHIYKTMIGKDLVQFPWLRPIIEHFEKVYTGYFPSFIHLSLDDFLDDQNKLDLFIEILEETKNRLYEKSEISTTELNKFEEKKLKGHSIKWMAPMRTDRLIRVIDYLIMALKDELKSTAGSGDDFKL